MFINNVVQSIIIIIFIVHSAGEHFENHQIAADQTQAGPVRYTVDIHGVMVSTSSSKMPSASVSEPVNWALTSSK